MSTSEVNENVTTFVICLSALDAGNKVSTNYPALRNLLYHARRLLPHARLGVLQAFLLSDLSEDKRKAAEDFVAMIADRRPAGCQLLPSPTEDLEQPQTLPAQITKVLRDFL